MWSRSSLGIRSKLRLSDINSSNQCDSNQSLSILSMYKSPVRWSSHLSRTQQCGLISTATLLSCQHQPKQAHNEHIWPLPDSARIAASKHQAVAKAKLCQHQRLIDGASTSTAAVTTAKQLLSHVTSSTALTWHFGAKKVALNSARQAQPSQPQQSVSVLANNNRHALTCSFPLVPSTRTHLSDLTTTTRCISSQHRFIPIRTIHFSSLSTMDHIPTSESLKKRDSLFDSSESETDSLPELNESGHEHYGKPIASSRPNVDCQYLKTIPDKNVYRIVVEGNIGSGKTTFLKIFSKTCSSLANKPLILPEPIDLWRNVGGVNIFQLLGDNPQRWSFAFQSYVQLTMIKIHELQPDEGNFKVMERSLFSARYCFVENLFRKKLLQPCEYFILDQWFQASLPSAPVDLIIYLKSDPDVVFERIKKRARPEESGLTLEYLRTLHQLHEDWLVHKKFPLPAEVLTIDANTPLDKIMAVYEEKTDNILRERMQICQSRSV